VDGVVTGVAPGTTSVIATAVLGGQTGQRNIGVLDPVATVGLSVARTAIRVGETLPTTVTLTGSLGGAPLTGRLVTYNSSNPAAVTVSAAGVVTSVGVGSANVTASSEGKTSPALAFTVTLAPIASVSLTSPDSSIFVGQQIAATAVARDTANNVVPLAPRTVVWSSSTPAVATVTNGSSGGAITAVAVGASNISVTVDGVAPSGAIPLSVSLGPVSSVVVSPSPHSMLVGANFTFTATTLDSAGNTLTGRTIVWASSDSAKATINASTGATVAIDSGTTNITATSEGKTGTSVLTVSLVPIATVSFLPNNNPYLINGTGQTISGVFQILASDGSGNPLGGRACTLSSSDTNSLTVSPASATTNGSGKIDVSLTSLAVANGIVVTANCEGKVSTLSVSIQ
jgi:uncharacterized protein YjdB